MNYFLFLSFFSVRPFLLVKQDWFGQACQDLWYVHWDNFSDHFREADLGGEWLSLDKKVKCKLMELLHRLQQKRHTQAQRHVLNKSYYKLFWHWRTRHDSWKTWGASSLSSPPNQGGMFEEKRGTGALWITVNSSIRLSTLIFVFWSYQILLERGNFLCAVKKKMQRFQRFNCTYCQEMF